jgi:hypothetical protein
MGGELGNAVVNTPPCPQLGLVVLDTATGRRGRVMGQEDWHDRWTGRVLQSLVYLRPLGGGVEWTADRADLRPG